MPALSQKWLLHAPELTCVSQRRRVVAPESSMAVTAGPRRYGQSLKWLDLQAGAKQKHYSDDQEADMHLKCELLLANRMPHMAMLKQAAAGAPAMSYWSLRRLKYVIPFLPTHTSLTSTFVSLSAAARSSVCTGRHKQLAQTES